MYDVAIVGGGPAGLSAALALGRCRRRVLICDAGEPRNAASPALHGFITRDGTNPLEFLRLAREELKRYPNVEFRAAEVNSVQREDDSFTLQIAGSEAVHARYLLLATGLVDELPPLEGLDQFYGKSVHVCPYCDGWEHQDQRLAVFGAPHDAAELAVMLMIWSADVVLCIPAGASLSHADQERVRLAGVEVKTGDPVRLEGEGEQIRAIVFADGSEVECSALFLATAQRPRSKLAQKLGCCPAENGQVECDARQATKVEGVFGIGNVTRGMQLVIIAAGEGTRAAFALNEALMEEELARRAQAWRVPGATQA